ncbi:acyltransferase family protein [Aureimonas leprariae]|uniref:acyltransferase family protein n=1 Tax=Plantimonas leprariae TaxID=2615207 RepID=UPI0013868C0C|nr:acyltransferase [Aureimonas leprariae]
MRALTGIRGIAAVAVVLYHVGEAVEQRFGIPAPAPFRHGYIAVDLFFVLSGFIIAYNYMNLFSGGFDLRSYATFIGKRVARLYPLYLVLTLVYFVKNAIRGPGAAGSAASAGDWAANLTMTHSWGFDAPRFLGVSWSISTEFLVYFLFPAMALALARSRLAAPLLAVLAVASIAMVALSGAGINGPLDVVREGSPLPAVRCFGGFVLGVLAHRFRPKRAGRAALRADIALFVAGITAIVLVEEGLDAAAVCLFPLVVALLADGGRLGDTLFAGRPVHRLGEWSYAVYLAHFLCINPALGLAGRIAGSRANVLEVSAIVLTLVPVVALSALLHRRIEVPGRRLFLLVLPPMPTARHPSPTAGAGES